MAEFVFGLIFMVIGVLAIIGAIFSSHTSRNPKVWISIAGIFFILLAGAGVWQSFYQSVPTKSEGVVTSYGKVIGTPYGPGRHQIAPWRTLNIVQDTIQSDSFFQSNGNGSDQLTPHGIVGNCISVRLAGLSSGCLDVQMQSQVRADAIPELYANYSSYGPSLTLDIDQYVVQRELKTVLNRPPLSDYNVIQDVSNSLAACIKKGQADCTANTSSQFSQFDPVILKALQEDPQLKGKIDILDVNLQFPHFDDSTEAAIRKIQTSYLETVEATQQERTNAAISTANAALVNTKSGQALTPAILQYDCYQVIQAAIKAGYTGLPATLSCGNGNSNVLVNGK